MKLLLDENLSPLHAKSLRDLGFDAISVLDIGLSGEPDISIRTFAISSDRILVTLDGDFSNILRYPPAKTPGVIRIRLRM